MAKDEPLLRDLRHEDTYRVVEPHILMPKIAEMFANSPDDALLVYDKKKDAFLGVMYLYDFLKIYGAPPNGISAIHKATVGQCANTNIISINWDENVSQAWAKINKLKPKGVLLHDKEKEFVGYLSSHDLWKGLKTISSDDTADALVEHSPNHG